MTRRPQRTRTKQGTQALNGAREVHIPAPDVGAVMRQALLPMAYGIAQTRNMIDQTVRDLGIIELLKMFGTAAEELVGPKKKHQAERTLNFWGTAATEFPLGGRRVSLPRPRVRLADGSGEATIPLIEHFRQKDPLPERVMDQILLGVSTRGYPKSLESPPQNARSRGTSKSAVSRHVVARTQKALSELTSRTLEGLDLVALMLDGIHVASQAVIVALGLDSEGHKHVLGLWIGSTENAKVSADLLQNLLDRGLKVNGRLLCVIDGGKGLRRALDDVFGDAVLVQRCQQHKLRNVRSYLPERRHAYVTRTMREAYKESTPHRARQKLQALAAWLERNGEHGAAASVKEGLEETLTVMKLGVPGLLRKFLVTTNAIENLIGTIRRLTRNVKRWRVRDAIPRWSAMAALQAEKAFHRVKGHEDIGKLLAVLRSTERTASEAVA